MKIEVDFCVERIEKMRKLTRRFNDKTTYEAEALVPDCSGESIEALKSIVNELHLLKKNLVQHTNNSSDIVANYIILHEELDEKIAKKILNGIN